ncbi:hypothetical protein, partial [uncultured Dubosiella sp.]
HMMEISGRDKTKFIEIFQNTYTKYVQRAEKILTDGDAFGAVEKGNKKKKFSFKIVFIRQKAPSLYNLYTNAFSLTPILQKKAYHKVH